MYRRIRKTIGVSDFSLKINYISYYYYLFKLFDLCVIIYNYSKSCSSSLRENEQELNSMIEKNPLLHELLRPLTNEKKERKKKGNPITRVIRFIENLFIPWWQTLYICVQSSTVKASIFCRQRRNNNKISPRQR